MTDIGIAILETTLAYALGPSHQIALARIRQAALPDTGASERHLQYPLRIEGGNALRHCRTKRITQQIELRQTERIGQIDHRAGIVLTTGRFNHQVIAQQVTRGIPADHPHAIGQCRILIAPMHAVAAQAMQHEQSRGLGCAGLHVTQPVTLIVLA